MLKIWKFLDNLNVGVVTMCLLCVIACHDVIEVSELRKELRDKEEIITSLTKKNDEQFGIICNLKIEKSELESKIEEMQNE